MSRKPTPSPDSNSGFFGCFTIFLICFYLAAVCDDLGAPWLGILFAIPVFSIFLYWLYGKMLLLTAWCRLGKSKICGVLVYSDSPNWKDYIENNWLLDHQDRFVILNYSHRKRWTRSFPVLLYKHFCGGRTNYNPAIVFLRGLRRPLVFRFFYAFRSYKHGDDQALKKLENRLFAELGVKTSKIE